MSSKKIKTFDTINSKIKRMSANISKKEVIISLNSKKNPEFLQKKKVPLAISVGPRAGSARVGPGFFSLGRPGPLTLGPAGFGPGRKKSPRAGPRPTLLAILVND
jgi:hypothetical protein